MIKPNVDEDPEKVVCLYAAVSNVNGTMTLENSFSFLFKTKLVIAIQPSNWTSFLRKIKTYDQLKKKLYTNVPRSFTSNSKKLETAHMSFNKWIVK